MSDYTTRLGPTVYNPETEAFEALVTFREGFEETRYPCSLRLPIDTDPQQVSLALIRQAQEMRKAARVPLVSKLRAHPSLTSGRLARRIAGAAERRAA